MVSTLPVLAKEVRTYLVLTKAMMKFPSLDKWTLILHGFVKTMDFGKGLGMNHRSA